MSYTVTQSSVLENTSAYKGFSNPDVIVRTGTSTSEQFLVSNGYNTPATTPAFTSHVAQYPRHGQPVGSPHYLPPVSIVNSYNTLLPVWVFTFLTSVLHKGHATSGSSFVVRNFEEFFHDALDTITNDNAIPGTAAHTFYTNIMNLVYPTTDVGSLPASPIQGASFVVDSVMNLPTTVIGGTGNTFMFVKGNVIIDSLAATGASDVTVLLVKGNVITTNVANWCTGAGTVIVVCTGDFTAPNQTAPSNVYLVSVGTATVDGTNEGTSVYFNGTSYNGYTFDPESLGFAFESHQANTYADVTGINEVYNDEFLTVFAGTRTNYEMTTLPTDLLQTTQTIAARLAVQYGVVPSSVEDAGSCFYIKTTFLGAEFVTVVTYQLSSTHMPNIGVHTEAHDFAHYIYPMLQTYRVNNTVYAPFTSGKVLECNPRGFISFSSTDFVPPPLPYYIGTTLINATNNMSISTGIVPNPTGGMDSYSETDSIFTSKYRIVEEIPAAPPGAKSVVIYASDLSYITYAPFNGRTSDADGVVRIFNGTESVPERRSRRFTMTLTCTQSKVAGETMQVYANASGRVFSSDLYVTYKNHDYINFVFERDFYSLRAGESIMIGTALYTYNVTGNVGTFKKIVNGVETDTTWTFGTGSDVTSVVHLTVIFGDTLMDDNYFNLTTPVESGPIRSKILRYNQKSLSYVDIHSTRFAASGLDGFQEMYLPGLSQNTIDAFDQQGIVRVDGKDDTWIDTVYRDDALFYNEVIIYGRRELLRVSSTEVVIPIADGTYENIRNETVTVQDRKILAESLPLLWHYVVYSVSPIDSQTSMITETIGDTYATFDEINLAYKLESKTRLSHSDVEVNVSIVSGKNKTSISGQGHVHYQLEDGRTLRIIFP